jgi:hypothetical protein
MIKNKTFLCMLCFCVIAIHACGKDSPETSTTTTETATTTLTVDNLSKKDSTSIRGMCLFFTQVGSFSDSDWIAIGASNCTDFMLIPKDAGTYGGTSDGYVASLAPLMIEYVNKLVSKRASAKIWIGTPGISSANYATLASSSTTPFVTYIDAVRSGVGETVWKKNIRGVYMNCESIYGTFDSNNLSANVTVSLMSALSPKIRTDRAKEFLWIPYYGYGTYATDITTKIAHVANDATIFDYVVMQPHYYFDDTETWAKNLYGVRSSAIKQSVCLTDGSVITAKQSKTLIGVEMEMDWHIVSPNSYSAYLSRYNGYVSNFSDLRTTNVPIVFYWDGNVQNALTYRINPFFQ